VHGGRFGRHENDTGAFPSVLLVKLKAACRGTDTDAAQAAKALNRQWSQRLQTGKPGKPGVPVCEPVCVERTGPITEFLYKNFPKAAAVDGGRSDLRGVLLRYWRQRYAATGTWPSAGAAHDDLTGGAQRPSAPTCHSHPPSRPL
jgi:hypothetical protein